MAHIILASSSPRRQELLSQLGLDFEVFSPDIDETVRDAETVVHYVERLAREKARAVLAQFPAAIVIAADTSLSFAGKISLKIENNVTYIFANDKYYQVLTRTSLFLGDFTIHSKMAHFS